MSEPSKIVPLKKSEQPDDKMLVTLSVGELRRLIAEEVAKAQPKAEKLLYTSQEAAAMLSLKKSWIERGVRAGQIACTRKGHYILFSREQIEAIAEKSSDA